MANPLVRLRSVTRARARLICFPGAAGAASDYNPWVAFLRPDIEFWGVDLPGRGRRFNEPLVSDLAWVEREVCSAILALPDLPTVLLGYSMGALLATRVVQVLKYAHMYCPSKLIVCASLPMGAETSYKEEVTFEEFRLLSTVSREIREDDELARLYYLILCSDLVLTKKLRVQLPRSIDCPIVVYGGISDRYVPVARLLEWATITTERVSVRTFPGEHEFLFNQNDNISSRLKSDLERGALLRQPYCEASFGIG
jgi:medium-chain acyl-[acyl-carrier-protein] hydrolase